VIAVPSDSSETTFKTRFLGVEDGIQLVVVIAVVETVHVSIGLDVPKWEYDRVPTLGI